MIFQSESECMDRLDSKKSIQSNKIKIQSVERHQFCLCLFHVTSQHEHIITLHDFLGNGKNNVHNSYEYLECAIWIYVCVLSKAQVHDWVLGQFWRLYFELFHGKCDDKQHGEGKLATGELLICKMENSQYDCIR